MALLWPDSDTARARGSLKQALHQLRQLLDTFDIVQGSSVLSLDAATIETDVGRLIVWRAELEEDGPPPGVFDEGGLGTGDGWRLRLLEVQPAGRDRMTWEAFLRGRPTIVGSSIVG